VQHQFAGRQPDGDRQPLCRFARQRRPDGEKRAGGGSPAQYRQKLVDRGGDRHRKARHGKAQHDGDNHRVLEQPDRNHLERSQLNASVTAAGDQNDDQTAEDDQIDRQHQHDRADRGLAQ